MKTPKTTKSKERFVFIFLGLFFGILGVHNFYAGYYKNGAIKLGLTIFCGLIDILALVCAVFCEIKPEQDNLPVATGLIAVCCTITWLTISALWIWSFAELFVVKTDAEGIELKPLD